MDCFNDRLFRFEFWIRMAGPSTDRKAGQDYNWNILANKERENLRHVSDKYEMERRASA